MEDVICYIGIDPGKTGFISTWNKLDGYSFYPMPYKKVDTGELTKTGKPVMKSVFHEKGLELISQQIFVNNWEKCKGGFKIAIEEVGGRGGWSATNNFNFGHVAGLIKMAFMHFVEDESEFVMVRPQKWQSYMRQGYPDLKKASSTGKTQIRDPKAVAQLIVDTEFPNLDFRKTERAKKNDDNKIDSFLILQYLIRTDEKR
jgi:hypothetical protein